MPGGSDSIWSGAGAKTEAFRAGHALGMHHGLSAGLHAGTFRMPRMFSDATKKDDAVSIDRNESHLAGDNANVIVDHVPGHTRRLTDSPSGTPGHAKPWYTEDLPGVSSDQFNKKALDPQHPSDPSAQFAPLIGGKTTLQARPQPRDHWSGALTTGSVSDERKKSGAFFSGRLPEEDETAATRAALLGGGRQSDEEFYARAGQLGRSPEAMQARELQDQDTGLQDYQDASREAARHGEYIDSVRTSMDRPGAREPVDVGYTGGDAATRAEMDDPWGSQAPPLAEPKGLMKHIYASRYEVPEETITADQGELTSDSTKKVARHSMPSQSEDGAFAAFGDHVSHKRDPYSGGSGPVQQPTNDYIPRAPYFADEFGPTHKAPTVVVTGTSGGPSSDKGNKMAIKKADKDGAGGKGNSNLTDTGDAGGKEQTEAMHSLTEESRRDDNGQHRPSTSKDASDAKAQSDPTQKTHEDTYGFKPPMAGPTKTEMPIPEGSNAGDGFVPRPPGEGKLELPKYGEEPFRIVSDIGRKEGYQAAIHSGINMKEQVVGSGINMKKDAAAMSGPVSDDRAKTDAMREAFQHGLHYASGAMPLPDYVRDLFQSKPPPPEDTSYLDRVRSGADRTGGPRSAPTNPEATPEQFADPGYNRALNSPRGAIERGGGDQLRVHSRSPSPEGPEGYRAGPSDRVYSPDKGGVMRPEIGQRPWYRNLPAAEPGPPPRSYGPPSGGEQAVSALAHGAANGAAGGRDPAEEAMRRVQARRGQR
jgi:hypothetical protein